MSASRAVDDSYTQGESTVKQMCAAASVAAAAASTAHVVADASSSADVASTAATAAVFLLPVARLAPT